MQIAFSDEAGKIFREFLALIPSHYIVRVEPEDDGPVFDATNVESDYDSGWYDGVRVEVVGAGPRRVRVDRITVY